MIPAANRAHEATQAVVSEAMRFGLARLQGALPSGKLAVPERIAISPKSMEAGSADRAAEIYRGQFHLRRRILRPRCGFAVPVRSAIGTMARCPAFIRMAEGS